MTLSHPPEDISSLEQIQQLVVQGFRDWQRYGNVSVHTWDDLLIFNYTARAIYEERWNVFECLSRGLIVHMQTGEIVARGFDKFWNWLQGGRQASSGAHIVTVTDKVDGSLGVLYRHRGQYRIAADIIAQTRTLDVMHEGYVVEFSDGSRFKFKGERYTELQRLLIGLSFKNTLKAIAGGSLDEIFQIVPDEFLTEVRQWVAEIEARVQTVTAMIEALYEQSPHTTRKEFAIWVMQAQPHLAHYLFARFDQKPLTPLIYAHEVWDDHAPPAHRIEAG